LQQEGEVGALTRRIALLEVDYEQTSARLSTASDKLDEASKHAEEAERYVGPRYTATACMHALSGIQSTE